MKIATMIAAWTIWLVSGRSFESSITTASMIGAKIAPRLSVRLHEGGCTWRPLRETGAAADDALRVGTSSGSSSLPSASSHTYSCRCSFARRRFCLRVGMWRLCPAGPGDLPALHDGVHHGTAEVVREVAPVVGVEQHDVRVEARREPSLPLGSPEDVRGVQRAGDERLSRREPQLRAREAAHERQRLA